VNTTSNTIVPLIALLVGFAACVTDVRSRRIPNLLTFGAAAAGIAVHSSIGGWGGFQTASTGWLAGTALFLPMFVLGGMGAGDVKLLAALGAWLGPRDAFWMAVYGSMAGGAMACAVAVRHGYLAIAFRNLATLLRYWWLAGPRPLPGVSLEHNTGPRLAYAIPIFIGTVITVWLQ
jgi:prepilin peptidase CpaA